ncbi:MAG: ArdC family protein [Sterolibacterium sp.]
MKSEQAKGMIDSALDKLGEQLEAGKSEQLVKFLKMAARFPNYSFGNTMLIAMQAPDATRVAGFWTWKKLGRKVRKGEHGIAIMAPVLRRTTIVLENEEELTEENPIAFRTVFVFDQSQTDGKPLEEPVRVCGDPGIYFERLQRFVTSQGIELEYSNELGRAEGVSRGGKIVLRQGLSPAEAFSVLCHETAHELLHRDKTERPDRATRETEAESVAFVVNEATGLENSTGSSDYLLTYKADRKLLMQSLQRIRRAAAQIIEAVTQEDEIASPMALEHPVQALAA